MTALFELEESERDFKVRDKCNLKSKLNRRALFDGCKQWFEYSSSRNSVVKREKSNLRRLWREPSYFFCTYYALKKICKAFLYIMTEIC